MPRFSVSGFSTLSRTFDEDLAGLVEGGAEGIGIAEFKLPEGEDAASLAKLRASGLQATICLPSVLSILPLPDFEGPDDPAVRIEALCASVRRLAAFDPLVVLVLTGPAGGRSPAEARRVVVEGLRRVSRAAQEAGVQVALEPIHRSVRDRFTLPASLPETIDLLDEVGEPVGVVFDPWHLWDTPDVLDQIRANVPRFGSAVHLDDWKPDARGWDDRALPGDGVIDLPAILAALEDGGFDGFYDLEILSGAGYPDSFQHLPVAELTRRGKAGLERAWEARRG